MQGMLRVGNAVTMVLDYNDVDFFTASMHNPNGR